MPVSNRLVNSFDYLCFIRIISVNIGDELFQTIFYFCGGACFTNVSAYLHVCVPKDDKHQLVRFLPKKNHIEHKATYVYD